MELHYDFGSKCYGDGNTSERNHLIRLDSSKRVFFAKEFKTATKCYFDIEKCWPAFENKIN